MASGKTSRQTSGDGPSATRATSAGIAVMKSPAASKTRSTTTHALIVARWSATELPMILSVVLHQGPGAWTARLDLRDAVPLSVVE